MGEDLEAKVGAWVEKSGHGLELRVAQAFGWPASVGQMYEDPNTATWRELDVVVPWPYQRRNLDVVYVIECKATNSPWVLFKSTDQPLLFNVDDLFLGRGFERGAERHLRLHELPLFANTGVRHYKLVTAFGDNKNDAWDATRQVMDGVRALHAQSVVAANRATIYMPVLVTAGPLLQAWLDREGILQTERIGRGLLQATMPSGDTLLTWVCQEGHLDAFVKDATRDTFGSL